MKLFRGLIIGIPISLVLWALILGVAFAEESPQVRALYARIGTEVNASIQCTTTALTLQDQLAALQAEVKRLQEKYEPKNEEPNK